MVIQSFADELVENIYNGLIYEDFIPRELQQKLVRMFDYLNAITDVRTIKILGIDNFSRDPGGVWSVNVSPQWRIAFKWFEGDIYNLELIRIDAS
jgi:proteic killer suppression protein